MGKENGARPWRQRDDDWALFERGELKTVIQEIVDCRLPGEHFSIETLQELLFKEYNIFVAKPATLREHINALVEAGDVTIARNGGGNGGPRVYHSESIRLDPTLSEGDVEVIEHTLEAEFIFYMYQGTSSNSIHARSFWDSDW